MDRWTSTLRALAAPRRAIPIVAIVGCLIAVQLYYGRDPRTAVVPATMSIAFVLLAPWSWRWLSATPTSIAYLLYAAEAAAVVVLCGDALPAVMHLGPTFLTDTGSLAVATMLYLIGGWGLGRDIELELDLEHTQLKAIRTHLDPHFLFNTLNAIAEWCTEDPKVAEDATLRLAAMSREILDGLELRTWPLARELAVARDLLELHRIRDPEAFTVTIGAAPTDIAVPPLVLVALVENAVKHGPRKGHKGPIVLRVAHDRITTAVRFEVENPGPFEPREPGRGLALLRKRLALSYGHRARLDIEEIAGRRTLAAVTVPA